MDIAIKSKAHTKGVGKKREHKRARFYSPGQVSIVALGTTAGSILALQYYLLEWQQHVFSFLKEGHNLTKIAKKAFGFTLGSKRDIVLNASSYYIVNTAILSCICIVLFFASSYFIYALLFGKGRVYKKEICKEVEKLDQLALSSQQLLSDYETELFKHLTIVGVDPIDQIGITRQIIHALENRVKEIKRLLEQKTTEAEFEALKLLYDNLNYRESSLDSLIQTQDTAVSLRLETNTLNVIKVLEEQFARVDKATRMALENANKYTKEHKAA